MLGLDALEVAIGVIFVFALVSVMCTAIREVIETWLKTRAAFLEHGIRELLNDREGSGIAKHFYNHPLIHPLFQGDYHPRPSKRPKALTPARDLPSYVPSRNFALALMEMAARGPATDAVNADPSCPAVSLRSIRDNVANLGNPYVQRAVLAAVDTAQDDLNRAQANLEAWYDSAMDRVSGWYKRETQKLLFWIALAVAVILNINAITIVDYLYQNDAVRKALVARAETAAKDTLPVRDSTFTVARASLDSLSLPIGWATKPDSLKRAFVVTPRGWAWPKKVTWPWQLNPRQWIWNVLSPPFGWLMTALAATLGAPFWFDMLNKVMVIRSTVKPHEKSPEESSEDRQIKKDPTSERDKPTPPSGREAMTPLPVPAPGAAMPAQPQAGTSAASMTTGTPRDDQSDVDGCELKFDPVGTPDDELPESQGGVVEGGR
jgi:hypothetical protein